MFHTNIIKRAGNPHATHELKIDIKEVAIDLKMIKQIHLVRNFASNYKENIKPSCLLIPFHK